MRSSGNRVQSSEAGFRAPLTQWTAIREIELGRAPSLRQRAYIQLEPSAWPHKGLSVTNRLVIVAILVSALTAILETEHTIQERVGLFFLLVEWAATAFFVVEYLARIWICAENPKYSDGWRGKFRYVRSPLAILDFLAIAPFLLALGGSESFLLRALRFVRILRLARLGRFSTAMMLIGDAVRSRRHELILSVGAAGFLLVVSSTLLYLAENEIQPEAFGSIPRSMWWAIATLTTVGYGDVYPITPLGRTFAAVTAVTGIGLIAMPTGILAAAFSDAMHRQRSNDRK